MADGRRHVVEFIKQMLHGFVFLNDDAEIGIAAKAVAQGHQREALLFQQAVHDGLGPFFIDQDRQAVIVG